MSNHTIIKECQLNSIDKSAEAILEICKQAGRDNEDKIMYDNFRKTLNLSAISFCVEKFVNAEIDFVTEGERGLGRMSDYTPRLGALYRINFKKLTNHELSKIYYLLQDIILRAYLIRPILVERPLATVRISSESELYEKWIPLIYSSEPHLTNSVLNAIEACVGGACEAMEKYFKDTGMLSNNKLDDILHHYIIAGYYMRLIEIGK